MQIEHTGLLNNFYICEYFSPLHIFFFDARINLLGLKYNGDRDIVQTTD